jgi:histidine ammonia-lyase
LEFAHDHVREFVSFASEDRIFADDINKVAGIIKDFSFVEKVNEFASKKKVILNSGYEGQFIYSDSCHSERSEESQRPQSQTTMYFK